MARKRFFTIGALGLVAGILALTLGSSAPASRPEWQAFSVPDQGLSGKIPPGWHLSKKTLVPRMVDPREVLSMGTGPLPVGGGGNCGAYPIKAIEAMGPRDAIISIQERRARAHPKASGGFPARPNHFDLRGLRFTSGTNQINEVMGYVTINIFFRDRGRAFTAMVATARPASSSQRRKLSRILDILQISPNR